MRWVSPKTGTRGFSDRLRSLPAPRIALLAGRALGDTGVLAWATAVTAAIGFAVGFRLHDTATQAFLAFGLCLVCGFAFLWIFICIGLVSRNAQAAQGLSMLAYPVIFVSSAYVRVNTLPSWMQPVAQHQPVTVMCNAVRSLALGDPPRPGRSRPHHDLLGISFAGLGGRDHAGLRPPRRHPVPALLLTGAVRCAATSRRAAPAPMSGGLKEGLHGFT